MKTILIILILLTTSIVNAQKTSVRGYRYEKTIKNNPNLSVYKKGDKRLYVIWEASKTFVYPNPTTTKVFFRDQFDNEVYGDAILMDVTGRILKRETSVSELSLARYAAGTYYITIITNDYVSHHIQVKL
jgi:hypothetical protein